jgi:hypothetical protein
VELIRSLDFDVLSDVLSLERAKTALRRKESLC